MSRRRGVHTEAADRQTKHASARVVVQSHATEFFHRWPGPRLVEVQIEEIFHGDIEGTSIVRALQIQNDDQSTTQVSMQQFCGKLGGREGSFILQGNGTVEGGRISSIWFVAPGSGTAQLSGLRGEGGFEGEFGKGSAATLDYWFE